MILVQAGAKMLRAGLFCGFDPEGRSEADRGTASGGAGRFVPATRSVEIGVRRGSRQTRSTVALALLLVGLTLAIYHPVGEFQFLNYDDDEYVTDDRHVTRGLSWAGVERALSEQHGGNWHPLTTLSHMLDVEIFGLDARGHHLVNVVLHAINAVLLLVLLSRITGAAGPSAIVAALFAAHPLNVQSVAWIAERKNVLSTLFWLLALIVWVGYARNPGRCRYALAFAMFVLGLISKPMVVTLPLTLLLLDAWLWRAGNEAGVSDGRSVRALLVEKLPFFAVSILFGLVTMVTQASAGALQGLDPYPPAIRIGNALLAYWWYPLKAVWPSGLSVFYPHPMQTLNWSAAALSALALVAVTLAVLRIGSRYRFLPVGWGWYVLTLLPVIGVVQVGSQAYADRYAYVPMIGLFAAVVWGARELARRAGHRATTIAAVAAVAVVAAFAGRSAIEVRHWRDSVALFERAVELDPENSTARDNLGVALAKLGRVDEAIVHFRAAIRARPDSAPSHLNLGNALAALGDRSAARAEYEISLRLDPDYAAGHFNLGNLLASEGRLDEAIRHYRDAVRLDRDHSAASTALGAALLQRGALGEALEVLSRAVADRPRDADAHYNLALALSTLGREREAREHLERAVALAPDHPYARRALESLSRGGRRGSD